MASAITILLLIAAIGAATAKLVSNYRVNTNFDFLAPTTATVTATSNTTAQRFAVANVRVQLNVQQPRLRPPRRRQPSEL